MNTQTKMKKALSSINLVKEHEDQTREMRERLYQYDSLISSYSCGPQPASTNYDPEEMAHLWLTIPAVFDNADVLVTAYVDGTCTALYDYHDNEMNKMCGGEEYELSFESLIQYLEQLPKPFHAYTTGLVED